MKPVKTRHTNVEFGKEQDEYGTLPAYRDPQGQVVTCWELTDEEIEQVIGSKKIYLRQLTFNQPLQPVSLHAENPVLDFVPHKQTRLHNPPEQEGNCFPTAIACIIGAANPEEVIQIQEHYEEKDWYNRLVEWLKERGWELKQIDGHLYDDSVYMVSGVSPRDKNVHHVVLFQNAKMVHDPHPDNTGIKSELIFESLTRIEQ
jgi:hypothetical protein